jgi:hypothetical protein
MERQLMNNELEAIRKEPIGLIKVRAGKEGAWEEKGKPREFQSGQWGSWPLQ